LWWQVGALLAFVDVDVVVIYKVAAVCTVVDNVAAIVVSVCVVVGGFADVCALLVLLLLLVMLLIILLLLFYPVCAYVDNTAVIGVAVWCLCYC
jgi:hypothetical protein